MKEDRHHEEAAEKHQESPQANKNIAHSCVPGVLSTAFCMPEMVKDACIFRQAQSCFLLCHHSK
jgi:hypothetical protein